MNHIVAGLIALAMTLIASGARAGEWSSAHHRTHPLVGTIWSAADRVTLSREDLAARLAAADYVVLGEIHPNPDHHRLQAWAIDAMAARGRKPSVAFEMIPASMAGALATHRRDRPDDTAGLGKALMWEKRGWPDWSIYEPIAVAAVRHGLPLLAGNLDRATTRAVARKGLEALSAQDRKRLDIGQPLAARIKDALLDVLADSHCGLLPKTALEPMVLVQRARDGAMAAALLDAAKTSDGAVLITGAGHGRNDWAVPAVIRRLQPGAKILSVAFMEVEPGAEDPADYLPPSADATSVYDVLFFTPRSEIRDHCAELKEKWGKKSKSN